VRRKKPLTGKHAECVNKQRSVVLYATLHMVKYDISCAASWRASGPPSAEHWTDRPSSTLQVDPPTLHRCLGISRALRRGRKMQLEFIIMCQHKLNMHACGD